MTGYLRDTKITCTCVVRVNCLTGCGKKNGFVFLGVEMGVTREGRGRISSCKVCVCACVCGRGGGGGVGGEGRGRQIDKKSELHMSQHYSKLLIQITGQEF